MTGMLRRRRAFRGPDKLNSREGPQVHPRGPLRMVPVVVVVGLLVAASRVDLLAASVALSLIVGTVLLLRRRDRRGERRALGLVGVTAAIAAVVVAVTLPAYRGAPGPLVVNSTAAATGSQAARQPSAPTPKAKAATTAHLAGAKKPGRPGARPAGRSTRPALPPTTVPVPPTAAAPVAAREVLGFAATDEDNTAAGLDRDVSGLTTMAATGVQLARVPGDIDVSPANDAVARAHLAGVAALAVVQNYGTDDFDGPRAQAVLDDRQATERLVQALAEEVRRAQWDGVVLDLEKLVPAARGSYPHFIGAVKAALGDRRVVVAVPATADLHDVDLVPYDLAAIGEAADAVVWMAYDQHDPAGDAGPVAGLPWVKDTLAVALASIPAQKVLLGVSGYGYAWRRPGSADEVTAEQAEALGHARGAHAAFDSGQVEWHATTADGRDLWWDDAQAGAERARVAADRGLGGVALWRLGSEDRNLLARLPFPAAKSFPRAKVVTAATARPIEQVEGAGTVALTFDDGPDATWTPKILSILEQEEVPGTFFVVGKQAQARPSLVRQEVADGNVVGDHTFSHPDLSNVPLWEEKLQVEGGAWVVEGITGAKPLLFRSPYGEGDAQAGSHRVGADQLAAQLGLYPEGWTDDPQDWSRPGADVIVQRALDGASERTVLLMHDGGGDRSQTVAALPELIRSLKARGYRFTTVDALDASAVTPYDARHGWSKMRGYGIVAAYRSWQAARRLVLWVLLATALLALLRVLVAAPLAVTHRLRSRRPPGVPPGWATTASILVPAYNEAKVLDTTLASLAALNPAPSEIILVDDGSTDGTADVAEAWLGRLPGLRIERQANAGKAAALNRAAALATGEVVVVIDADTIVEPGFLGAILPHFADPRVGAVAGNVKVGNRRSLLAGLQALEYIVSLNLDKRAQAQAGVVGIVPGAAGAFRTAALTAVGGYPSDTLVEDADLTVVLLRAGWRIRYEARAISWTEAPEHLSDVVKQRRRWCYGTIEVAAKHAGALFDRRTGRVGLILLPWQLASQVVMPLLSPLADLFLLYLLVVHANGEVLTILGIAVLADLLLAVVAVALDGERIHVILFAPLLRLLWRPLQLIVLARATRRWAVGDEERWRKVTRYGHVAANRPTAVDAEHPGRGCRSTPAASPT
ncbi:MAG: glycosyltransferase [Acidimicrobiales bacterium]